jgi:hypothetical protein
MSIEDSPESLSEFSFSLLKASSEAESSSRSSSPAFPSAIPSSPFVGGTNYLVFALWLSEMPELLALLFFFFGGRISFIILESRDKTLGRLFTVRIFFSFRFPLPPDGASLMADKTLSLFMEMLPILS